MNHLDMKYDEDFIKNLDLKLKKETPLSSWELFKLNFDAQAFTLTPSFDGLVAVNYLPNLKPLPHQIKTAKQVIEDMNGRAILADEVGLGKTIEAGLILKEYMVRGLVKKILILVPASLVNQWVKELNEKFYIPAVAYRKNYSWEHCDVMVASLDTAKRAPHEAEILQIDYDFIIIDEAHKLKNHQTKNYFFVKQLKKTYCLLLTATPIQNKLIEIFNLVSILKPGHLGNYESFKKKYDNQTSQPTETNYLKQLIQKVMVRHTRKQTIMSTSKRKIKTVWIEFTPEEQMFYEQLDQHIYSSPLVKLTLLREICSSREACFMSFKKMVDNQDQATTTNDLHDFIAKIEQLPHHAKANKIIEIIKKIGDEKIIIFTEYRATQYYLQWYLQQYGISSVPFRGGFKSGKKDWMRQLFKDHAQVLIATEAGGEGINLQFANHLINYDLPWNPMRLEQRIGRIHRYGQEKDVYIYNLAILNTVEEHIMKTLYNKLNLFEGVIGKIDDILAELRLNNLETEVKNIFRQSETSGEMKIKLDHLTSVIQQQTLHERGDYYDTI